MFYANNLVVYKYGFISSLVICLPFMSLPCIIIITRTSNTMLVTVITVYTSSCSVYGSTGRSKHNWSDLYVCTVLLIYRESNQSFINKYDISWESSCRHSFHEIKEVSFLFSLSGDSDFYHKSVWIFRYSFLHQLISLYDFSSLASWYSRLQQSWFSNTELALCSGIYST